ncbi:MAG TPA: phosphotransferase [Mycobacteriales bacterium]|nr:phosphotransferase [Mycobacteriales bacterium]
MRGVAEPAWTAERVVTGGEAAALPRRQFPALRAASVEPLAEGWDRTVHVVDGRWAFRFPRRARALPGVAREVAVLPSIAAAALPLPVPVPAFAGVPSGAYPWQFWGAALLPGRELAEAGPPGRVSGSPPTPCTHCWTVRTTPTPARPSWSTDLRARDLLVDGRGRACGVIDWGDVCLADPAPDPSLDYAGFAGAARAALLGADRETTARVLAVFLSAALAEDAASEGRTGLLREALAGLRRAVSGPRAAGTGC